MYLRLTQFLSRKLNFDAHYFMSGGFWLFVTQACLALLGIVTTALFAHFLSESEYGTYRYLIGLGVIFSSFSLASGLGQSIAQTTAQNYKNFYNEILPLNFKTSLVITLCGGIAAAYYFYQGNLTLAIGLSSISIFQPLINIFQFIPGYFLSLKQYKKATYVRIFKTFIAAIASLATLFFTTDTLVLFLVFLGTDFVTNLLLHTLFKPCAQEKTPAAIYKKYVNYAYHTSFRNIITNISFRLDTILIFTQIGSVQLAGYAIAVIIPEQIKGSLKNISTLLLPKFAVSEHTQLLKKNIRNKSILMFLLLILITIIYILLAPIIYGIIFPKYPEAVLLSQIAALAFPAFVVYIPFTALQAQLAEKKLHQITLVHALTLTIFTVTGVIFAGVIGVVIAKALARYVYCYICFHLYLQESGTHRVKI